MNTAADARTGPGSGLAAAAAAAFADYRAGQEQRMSDLVDLLTGILWHAARAQGADPGTAEDAVQSAWLALVDHAEEIREPRAVLAWLLSTTRRQAARAVRRGGRHEVLTDTGLEDSQNPEPAAEELALLDEGQRVLWEAVLALDERCRQLLRVIAYADRPDYAGISEAMGMPVGSIGPTRGRCLQKLRTRLDADPRWTDGGQP